MNPEVIFSSAFWNWWIIALTLANILGCWWLISWSAKKVPGEAAVGEVTGHRWDGDLQEYNNPLPRWWLWLFYITLVFSLGYLALYPGLGKLPGLLGWTPQKQYQEEIAAAEAAYQPLFARYAQVPLEALSKDPQAVKIGQRLFVNYCAGCHGSDARGNPGFPDLSDHDWLYGGDPRTIETSILDGRNAAMPAWQEVVGDAGVDQLTAYVRRLAGLEANANLAADGEALFATYCAGCHGSDAGGNQTLGAPNLHDRVWLYGGSAASVRESIAGGRNGHMPAHREFLGTEKVHLLAAFIYSLSRQ